MSLVRYLAPAVLAAGLLVGCGDDDGKVDDEKKPPVSENAAPVAAFDAPSSAKVGATVTLDASRSSDPDGDELTFAWVLDAPEGSAAALTDASARTTSFVPDVEGTYTVTLTVSDGKLTAVDTATIEVSLESANEPPIAVIEAPTAALVGETVNLDASESSDPDGDTLTFAWELTAPAGSNASLADATAAETSFVADVEGNYTVTLTVSDGELSSTQSVTVAVSAAPVNQPPVADAGEDVTLHVGTAVTLDGTGSSDPEGATLTYRWSFAARPEGSLASFDEAHAPKPTFTPDVVGTYTVELVVNDGELDSAAATVTVEATNEPPVVDAGEDLTGSRNAALDVVGTATDADGDELVLTWSLKSQVEGANVQLGSTDALATTFRADLPGAYVLELTASDPFGGVAADTVTITIENAPPVAAIQAPATAAIGETVTVFGTIDDVDGDDASFEWTLVRPDGSNATLSQTQTLGPAFVPDVPGSYRVIFTADDGYATHSTEATVAVSNRLPTVSIGTPAPGRVGELFALAAEADANDPGQVLTWNWTLTSRPSGSNAALADAGTATPSFTPDKVGDYVVTVTVNDGYDTATASATIQVPNRAPTVTLAQNLTGRINQAVELTPTATDPDGEPLTFSWTLQAPQGSTASLASSDGATNRFTPDLPGSYVVTVVVNDGHTTATDSTTVTVVNTDPVIQSVVVGAGGTDFFAGDIVSLMVTASDADGQPLSYAWSFTTTPGAPPTIDQANSAMASFVVPTRGTYTGKVVVSDGFASVEQSFQLTVQNSTPIVQVSNRTGVVNSPIELHASATDPDGDALTYRWELLQHPDQAIAVLTDPESATAWLTTDLPGIYTVQLTVTDAANAQTTRWVDVTVSEVDTNTPPVADAGEDRVVNLSGGTAIIVVTGIASSDADGDPLTYTWTVTRPDGTPFPLVDPNGVEITIEVDTAGDWLFTLVVHDGQESSAPATVTITVNTPPVAEAGADQTVEVGDTVTLSAAASIDPDGDALTYDWTFVSVPTGSTAAIANADQPVATFVADVAGTYQVMLEVDDGEAVSSDTVTITAEEAGTPAGPCLVISEYVEGSGNNKAIELYNCGTTEIDLSGYRLCQHNNGATTCTYTLALSGRVAAGDVYVICNSSISNTSVCDMRTTNSTLTFNGDDAVVLSTTDGETVDVFGTPGQRLNVFADKTFRRECSLDPYLGGEAFNTEAVWGRYYRSYPQDSLSDLGVPPVIVDCSQP